MKLFGEKVKHTFTNSPHNILECKDYNEIFFDVYEIELNNGKYPVEKVSVYGGNPVVMVPIIVEGEEKEYPFILMKGKENIIFNEDNISVPVDEDVSELFEEDVDIDRLEQTRQEILEQISKAKKDASIHAEQIKKQKIQEAQKEITLKKKALDDMVSSARESLVDEFLNISKKIKGEFISENGNRWEEIRETIDNKIEDISSSLSESLRKDFSTSEQQFDSKIRELVKELYKSLQPKIDNDLKDIAKEIFEKVNSIETGFDKKFQKSINDIRENVTDVALEMNEKVGRVKSEISQKVEKIDKNVNKSLSRVGSLDKKVDKVIYTISEEIDHKLKETEDQISKSWNDKLKLLEDKNLDINDKNRKYLIDLITESKHGLIEEVRKISKQAPIEYVVEANNTKKNINQDDIVKDLEKKINFLVGDVETRLRKYVAVYGGGGGTVATQYQDGGLMNGNLTVVGSISASEYLGIGGGSQTITLTGDVIGTGSGILSTFISEKAVTLNKIQDIGHEKIIGRHGSGSGTPQEIGIDGGLEFHGGNIRRSALSGDITVSAGDNNATLANTGISAGVYIAPTIIYDSKGRALSATSNGVVINTGTQSISGSKTFVNGLSVVGNTSVTGNLSAGNLVYNTGDQSIDGSKTFLQNVVGNGTNNRLPNQQLNSNDAILTWALMDNLVGWNFIPWNGASTTTYNTGTATVNQAGINVQLVSGATGVASLAGHHMSTFNGQSIFPYLGSEVNIFWSKRLRVRFGISSADLDGDAVFWFWVGCSGGTPITNNPPTTSRGYGIRLDNSAGTRRMTAVTHDGTNFIYGTPVALPTLGLFTMDMFNGTMNVTNSSGAIVTTVSGGQSVDTGVDDGMSYYGQTTLANGIGNNYFRVRMNRLEYKYTLS